MAYDDKPSNPQPAVVPKDDGNALRTLFDTLVPPDTVTVTDITGGEHVLRTVLSASKQIKVFRRVSAVLASPALAGATAAPLGMDLGSSLASIVALVADEGVVHDLGLAFAEAYPEALVASRARVAEATGIPCSDPVEDLFAIEEVAAALVPLFVRLGRRLIGAFADLGDRGKGTGLAT